MSSPINFHNIFDLEAHCSDDEKSVTCSPHSSDADFIVDDNHTPTVYTDSLQDDEITLPECCVPNALAAWFFIHQPYDYHPYFVDQDFPATLDTLRSIRVEFDWTPFDTAFVQYMETALLKVGHFEVMYDDDFQNGIEYHFDCEDMLFSDKLQWLSEFVKYNGTIVYFTYSNSFVGSDIDIVRGPTNCINILPPGLTQEDINTICDTYDELGGNDVVDLTTPPQTPVVIDLTNED